MPGGYAGQTADDLGQLADRFVPGARGQLAGALAQQGAVAVGDNRLDRSAERLRACRVVEQPGLQVSDHVGRAARAGCDDRNAAGRRLAQHVAAGLVLAGVDEHVQRWQRDGEVSGLQLAGELGAGQAALEPATLRPVPDHHCADRGHRGQLCEAAYAVPLVQAPDEADHDALAIGRVLAGPPVVQPLVAQGGSKCGRVDARRPQLGVDTELGDPLLHPLRRDQQPVGAVGHLRAPVVGGEVEHRRLLDDHRGHVVAASPLECFATNGAGRGDMNHVGAEVLEPRAHLRTNRVERLDPDHDAPAIAREARCRGDDQNLVTCVDKAVGDCLERGRGAVDGREEGLGHQCDLHAHRVAFPPDPTATSRCPTREHRDLRGGDVYFPIRPSMCRLSTTSRR